VRHIGYCLSWKSKGYLEARERAMPNVLFGSKRIDGLSTLIASLLKGSATGNRLWPKAAHAARIGVFKESSPLKAT